MKPIPAILFIFFIAVSGYGQTLTLQVENIKDPKGQLLVTLFSSAESFLSEPSYIKTFELTPQHEATVTIEGIPLGVYALCVIHDKNSNGALDTNFLKIPREPYGFSNNARNKIGPPSYEQAQFHFERSTEFVIKLN